MKSKHKALLLALCVVLLVAATAFGTYAYLTDTEAAKNTFTVGKVDIELDEAKVNEDGTAVDDAERVHENEYHLLPGHTYIKDPTVTVKAGSEEVYVRMLVTVDDFDDLKEALPEEKYYSNGVFLLEKLVTGWDRSNWEISNVTGNVYEFRYVGAVYQGTKPGTVNKTDADIKLDALFDTITLPGEDITNTELATLDELQINIVAHAIQAAGFDTADDAWSAFDTQNS